MMNDCAQMNSLQILLFLRAESDCVRGKGRLHFLGKKPAKRNFLFFLIR